MIRLPLHGEMSYEGLQLGRTLLVEDCGAASGITAVPHHYHSQGNVHPYLEIEAQVLPLGAETHEAALAGVHYAEVAIGKSSIP